jgi:hypothetical protein
MYAKRRPVPRRIVCPKCGTVIDLSGESAALLAPSHPSSLDEVRRLFSADERELLEFGETSMAYTVKPKAYLGRKAFGVISEVVKLAGGHYFSAGRASKFIIPKEEKA